MFLGWTDNGLEMLLLNGELGHQELLLEYCSLKSLSNAKSVHLLLSFLNLLLIFLKDKTKEF